MEPEHFICALVGAMFALILMAITAPDHKANCDQFGATSFNKTVYDCHPKQPAK